MRRTGTSRLRGAEPKSMKTSAPTTLDLSERSDGLNAHRWVLPIPRFDQVLDATLDRAEGGGIERSFARDDKGYLGPGEALPLYAQRQVGRQFYGRGDGGQVARAKAVDGQFGPRDADQAVGRERFSRINALALVLCTRKRDRDWVAEVIGTDQVGIDTAHPCRVLDLWIGRRSHEERTGIEAGST
jgi:hypothetical protein